jgi:hypothetical protein
MNLDKLKLFLEKFDIKKEDITKIISNKKIIVKENGNVLLTNENLKNNETQVDEIIFIKLNKLLPTKYLLKTISLNSKNIVDIKNDRKGLDFTYGKDLMIDMIKTKIKLENNKYYVTKFDNKILGYSEFKNNKLKNIMNIGEYLKEN